MFLAQNYTIRFINPVPRKISIFNWIIAIEYLRLLVCKATCWVLIIIRDDYRPRKFKLKHTSLELCQWCCILSKNLRWFLKKKKSCRTIVLTPTSNFNSPYCQQYNSYNVSSENLLLDQLIIPKSIFIFILITYLVDIVLILSGKILSWSPWELKG